jgi:EAL domain-containing protein (putative c-di-GMP-specific phosphodiesterase class I)
LKQLGVTLSLDDFGTGYSSLNYLVRFPLDYLKIDRSFVQNIPHDCSNLSVTTAIIALAKMLNLKVIAEGIENIEQHNFLRLNGCDEAQGFMFSRPVAPDVITEILQSSISDRSCYPWTKFFP